MAIAMLPVSRSTPPGRKAMIPCVVAAITSSKPNVRADAQPPNGRVENHWSQGTCHA